MSATPDSYYYLIFHYPQLRFAYWGLAKICVFCVVCVLLKQPHTSYRYNFNLLNLKLQI